MGDRLYLDGVVDGECDHYESDYFDFSFEDRCPVTSIYDIRGCVSGCA